MEKIINTPGLQHLAEKVFSNLDVEDLKSGHINQSCNQILEDPMYWLRKFVGLSKENRKDWFKIIQSVKNFDCENVIVSYLRCNLNNMMEIVDLTVYLPYFWLKKFRSLSTENQKDWSMAIKSEKNFEKEKAVMDYLQRNLLKESLVNLPCYTNPAVQDDFRKQIFNAACGMYGPEIVRLVAPLTDNPNAPDNNGATPMHLAAWNGYREIVKILVPLTDNPNAPDKDGSTPIHLAAWKGYTEIVKILVPLTDNPNAPNNKGITPFYWALHNGHTKIVNVLESFNTSI